MHRVKRLLASFMCGVMCVTSIHVPAFAEPVEVDYTQDVDLTDDAVIDVTNEQYDVDQTQTYINSEEKLNIDSTLPSATSSTNRWVKERTVSAECSGIHIYVNGMLPYQTALSVKPVNRYKQNNYEAVIDGQDDTITREVLTVLDVTLINAEGEEFEPDDTMQVTFAGGGVEDGIADSEKEIEVYHVVDDAVNYTGSNATEDSFQVMATETVEASGVTFETDSFWFWNPKLKSGR